MLGNLILALDPGDRFLDYSGDGNTLQNFVPELVLKDLFLKWELVELFYLTLSMSIVTLSPFFILF